MEKKSTHIIYGFITSIVMIVVGLVLHLADLSFEPWAQWVTYAVFFIGILINAFAFSKANHRDVTFGNVFSSGFKASAIITLVMLVWSFISVAIFPEITERAFERSAEQMTKQGMSDEQIDEALEMTKKYFKLFMVMGVVFGFTFFGALFSVISAAIAPKNPPQPQAQ